MRRSIICSYGHFVFYEILCCSNLLVELHLGDVLEVLLGVGSKNVCYSHNLIVSLLFSFLDNWIMWIKNIPKYKFFFRILLSHIWQTFKCSGTVLRIWPGIDVRTKERTLRTYFSFHFILQPSLYIKKNGCVFFSQNKKKTCLEFSETKEYTKTFVKFLNGIQKNIFHNIFLS